MALFMQGLVTIMDPLTFVLMILGTAVGILFGALPGLTATMAVALFLPVTYGMTPAMGLAILISLWIGATSGGLISAILLKIPGTPSSVATCFDGHPMQEKGEGAKALGVGIVFSTLGTMISLVALIFIAPPLAKIALSFGPVEYFAIAIFSLMLIVSLSTDSMLKGIFSGLVGFVFATVGIAPVDAVVRYTFGSVELTSGFNTLSVLIGLFAISEVIKTAESSKQEGKATIAQVNKIKGFGFSMKELMSQKWNFLISALIGIGIGILPGIGGGTSNIVAYMVAKKTSKYPEKFGTGIIDGIVAPETANNASIGGALIPLLTLGIPGDAVTALLLGGFMIHGIAPGPMLFVNYGPLVYTVFAAVFVGTIMMIILEFAGIRIFVKLLAIPNYILIPIVFVLCVVGAFGLQSRVFDVWSILLFGAVGYYFVKFKVPQAPFIIGFVLGPMAETNFRRGLMMTDNSFIKFFESPIAAAFMILTIAVMIWTIIGEVKKKQSVLKQGL
ncbi:MAG: tripartite tricarboxylate transporter permease [Youngiibacter sp.]|nr:tripartite tricarboxylate transporter permease [Youngiibacter sp.]